MLIIGINYCSAIFGNVCHGRVTSEDYWFPYLAMCNDSLNGGITGKDSCFSILGNVHCVMVQSQEKPAKITV